MPVFLLTFVEGLLGPRFAGYARYLIYAVGLLLLVGGFFGLKSCYDHRVINAHESQQKAANAEANRKADNNAANQRVADNSREANEAQETQNAIDKARQSGADPRAAYYQCVHLQQSARHAGRPPPSC